MENTTEAKKWLGVAIRRHERHMAGKEPTSGDDGKISQKLMMEEMVYSMECLAFGHAIVSEWYEKNIGKFPDKNSGGDMEMK